MFMSVNDTTFDKYMENIATRQRKAREALRSEEHRYDYSGLLKGVLDWIEWDEFTKTRLPGIVGMEHLRNHISVYGKLSEMSRLPTPNDPYCYVLFTEKHGVEGMSENWTPCTTTLPHEACPRIGLETGVVQTAEDCIWVYYTHHKILIHPSL